MPALTIHQIFDLALTRHREGKLHEAESLYRQVIIHQPSHADAIHLLGVLVHQSGNGRGANAVDLIHRAIALRPNFAEAYSNLSMILRAMGQYEQAIATARQATILRPNMAEAHNNLGVALGDHGQFEEAIVAYRNAIGLRPDYAEAWRNLGVVLKDTGQLDEAIAAHRQAIALRQDYPDAHSNLAYALHFHSDYSAQDIFEEHRRWNKRHAAHFQANLAPRVSADSAPHHANDRDPDRRLRIGYVSPDFRAHPVARFLMPLLDHHDRSQFEIFCYSDVARPDSMTQRVQANADTWRPIAGLADEVVTSIIRDDQIDILVDLAMHTNRNRLLVFARKPAPVQVTYLAYCSTTGLDAMDYRLTDSLLDPPGESDQNYSERSVRLPNVYWCYEPKADAPEVAPLPALAARHITFGSLNNFGKASPEALSTWNFLLRELPLSRLMLHARQGELRVRTLDKLAHGGVDPARITFVDFLPGQDYLRQYDRIDIGLDPFPFAGGTTTCDALWMGVPVITLAGRTAVGRSGVTLLNSIGLGELVAGTREEYVRLAVRLAADLPRLAQLRASLRDRMRASSLMDAPRFAADVEAAFRWMWRNLCSGINPAFDPH